MPARKSRVSYVHNRHYEKVGNEVKDITDEIDFDLPDGWGIARIGFLFYIQTGASFKKEQATNDKTKIRILRGGNIVQNGYSFFDNDIFIDYSLVSNNILLRQNDIITPAVTSIENIGKLALIERDYDNVSAGGFVFICRPYLIMGAFAKYLLFALQSHYFNSQMKSITKKSGQAFYNLGKERLVKLLVPIPPLAEQERIVVEIEKYKPLIEEYDKLEQAKYKIDSEIYDKLKKSILQFAIQGKLVQQDENDEPASELLKRIRAEKKAQLGKKYVDSYIYKGDDNCYYEKVENNEPVLFENLPFDIPNSWCWARLGDYITLLSGRDLEPSQYNAQHKGIPYITGASNFNKGCLIVNRWTDTPVVISHIDDLLITCKGTIGEMAYNKIGNLHIARQVMALNTPMNIAYIEIYLKSKIETLQAQAKSMIPGISRADIENALTPIPPLEEQKQIVNKMCKILNAIEKDEV